MSRNPSNLIMKNIPLDVIRDILPRLAVKDLLRFKCVSEFFRSVIDSLEFGKLHLSHSQNTNTDLYGIFHLGGCEHPQIMLLGVFKSVNSVSGPVAMVNRPQIFEHPWEVVGSCNGLIALRNISDEKSIEITIWNPFTGSSKKVGFSLPHNSEISYGFGYDPETDDYKLVWIVNLSYALDTQKTAVYSLKTNSWKEIGTNGSLISEFEACFLFGNVLVDNALHWGLCYDGGDSKIIAFNFSKEEFYHVLMLECFKDHHVMAFGALDGCLTLSFNDQKGAYVWVMKEYGVKDSWTKLLYLCWTFDVRPWLRNGSNVIPLAYSSDGKRILLNHRGSHCGLFWYDLSTGEAKSCFGNAIFYRGDMKTCVGSFVAFNESTDEVDLKKKRRARNMPKKRRTTRGEE